MEFANSCIANAKAFYNEMPDTDIKFLFFFANDLSQPKIRSVFRRWNVEGDTFYVIEGLQSGRNAFYMYIYKESIMKYFVRVRPLLTSSIDDAAILASSDKGDVNHGDHVTAGIRRQRTPGQALFSTHSTKYVDDVGDFNFSRHIAECNVLLTASTKDHDVTTFGAQRCEMRVPESRDTMGYIYDSSHVHALHQLSQAAQGVHTGGGNRNEPKRRYHVHKGKRYLVRRGKDCRFIDCRRKQSGSTKKRVIIQRGGAYNGVTFMSDAFIAFLVEHVVKQVQVAMPYLEAACIIYDELDDLCEGASEHIVMVYEFAHWRNVFYLKAHDALVSCYVETAPQGAIVTPEERQTHDAFKRSVASLVQTVSVVS
jgi:hypothetical protein